MKSVSHYRIVRPLGAGGMGEVYLAEDPRLKRNVAIKILPRQFASDPERLRRFEQEARAASALNHPNIVTIYDVGEEDGTPYIVTEHVEGETLRDRLARGRVSLRESLEIAVQVAEALAAAHEAGIVHRDVKPENVMLRTDGYAKVLDFGLAKLGDVQPGMVKRDAPTLPRLETEPGRVMGTVHYMSPEQARGLPVDASTDVFSLGVVLYELLSGRLPFDGETKTDVILSILSREPPPLASFAPGTPPALERVVARSLAKERDARYASAEELARELASLLKHLDVDVETDLFGPEPRAQRGATPAVASRRRLAIAGVVVGALVAAGLAWVALRPAAEAIDSLAVLPFENAGGDESEEYLSEGITESLINALSQTPGVKVMSRNAVWRYRATRESGPPDPRRVAKDLGVRAVLTGRVARRGDRLSLGVALVDARDARQIWGASFERGGTELLSVQEEIVATTLERLGVAGDDAAALPRARGHTQNTEAYERYIRGRYYLSKRSAEAIRKGREFFQQAIDEDPAYALAYSGISDSYALLAAQGAMRPDEAYPPALAAARKAVELDSELGEGHASLAHAALHTDDLATAEREFARAIELKPDYVSAHLWRAEYLDAAGRRDDAFASVRTALRLDPLDLASNAQLAWLMIGSGDDDGAIAQLKKTLEIDPNYFLAHKQLGMTYLRTQQYADAIREFDECVRLTSGRRGLDGLGLAYAKAGEAAKAREVLRVVQARSAERLATPLDVAQIHAALGDREETLRWLSTAVEEEPSVREEIKASEEYSSLRGDARFEALVRGEK